MNTDPTYNPLEFIGKVEIITVAIIGSFVTLKLLNVIYENLYEPAIEILISSKNTDKYYLKIGRYYIQAGMIIKEFIKWIILIILLMISYNLIVGNKKNH